MYGESIIIKDSIYKESDCNLPIEARKQNSVARVPVSPFDIRCVYHSLISLQNCWLLEHDTMNFLLGNGKFRAESPQRAKQRMWKNADNASKLSSSIFLRLLFIFPTNRLGFLYI
jgi:hypothetical protein